MNVSWALSLLHHLSRGGGSTQGSCCRASWDSAIPLAPAPLWLQRPRQGGKRSCRRRGWRGRRKSGRRREVGRSRSRTNKREGEVRTDGGMERKRPVATEVVKEEGG